MDAELEVRGQAVLLDGEGDGGDVLAKLAGELGDVADVVDALVEAAGELGRDGLDGNLLVGDGGEDDEQLDGRLGRVGLVHRDLGDEVAFSLPLDEETIDAASVLDGGEELVGDRADEGLIGVEGLGDAGDADGSDELGVARDEGFHVGWVGRLADHLSDVEGEEVAGREEALDGGEVDVVGIEIEGRGPAKLLDGGIGGLAGLRWIAADDVVLAIGLVPDGHDFDSGALRLNACGKLRLRLVGETVADPYRKPWKLFHQLIHPSGDIGPTNHSPILAN